MFLETSTPSADGALVALEIVTADAKVAVDARVLWTRAASAGEDQPAGMSVRFIDLPDDVSVALNRALQGGMQERTILGVGGATQEPTQIGIPAPSVMSSSKPVSRATQLGVAPPANTPVAVAAKPKLVIADTSLPETPIGIPAAPSPAADPVKVEKAPAEKTKEPRAASRSMAPSAPPNPPMQGGALGRIVALLLLGGAATAVYLYREPLGQMIAGPQPTTTATPPPLLIPIPSTPASAAASTSAGGREEDAASSLSPADLSRGSDASASDALDAGHSAGPRDAGRDGGGKHDAGAHGRHDAGRPKHPRKIDD